MRARHVTSQAGYRTPFGAVPVGTKVELSIDVWDEPEASAQLRLWIDGEGERLIPMEGREMGDHLRFTASFAPSTAEVVWYTFFITAADGAVWRYGAAAEHACGEGAFSYGEPPSFQITVYQPARQVRPDWYQNGIVYQIFPDRFARGEDWRDRGQALEAHRKGPRRVLVEDWDKPVSYARDPDGSIAQWDFYGGTLRGIRGKLDYLQSMGITVIYLNPIFEAASNHRYDTADYLRVDPLLGDEEEFSALCEDAAAHGISIILDGVFNHSGRDSRYFNAFGNYLGTGAIQSPSSPYRDWYKIADDGSYASWWGVGDLPDFNQDNPEYRQLICGHDGVIRKWLRLGARGWRLDVADELSDDFIADIKAAALAEKPDAVVIGEVWEDASNKEAYGKLRHYFWGSELDGTMNYPFRSAAISFLRGEEGAPEFAATMESLRENYPAENFYGELNLLGSHDRSRLLTLLGGAPLPDGLSEEERAGFRLTKDQRSLAISRLWDAALLQMTMPGVPCVYYGDEAGLEGYADPYCRGTYPWGHEDESCRTIYRNAIAVRKALPVLTDGDFEPFALDDDVFGFWRRSGDEQVCVLINRSLSDAKTLHLPMVNEAVDDVVSGQPLKVSEAGDAASGDAVRAAAWRAYAAGDPARREGGAQAKDGGRTAEVFLWPLGSSVLYFHRKERLQQPTGRGLGVLAHITSLPNVDHPGEPGTLGEPARRFIDYLAAGHVGYWEVLPVNPTDDYGSPYAGLSAFAGNPALMWGAGPGPTSFQADFEDTPEYRRFVERNERWLIPYAAFRAIKAKLGDSVPWQKWPERYRDWDPAMADDPELAGGIRRECGIQFEFQRQWDETRRYANERGIKIVGDIPMYVSADSSDVWAERDLFKLGPDGSPASLAGTPPDNFNPDGQIWGNPTYDWARMRADGYDWWMRRLERMFELYDYVRLDHFLGFSSYFTIPAGEGARAGRWNFGPGADLFEHARDRFGELPVIAEDLGSITPAVRALVAKTGFPGMDVIQFSDKDPREGYAPAPGSAVFSSTHDTQTLLGWVKSRYGAELHEDEDEERRLARELLQSCVQAKEDLVMVPLQDVLLLDDSCRMNVPGVASGNWSWRADEGALMASADFLRRLADDSGRASSGAAGR